MREHNDGAFFFASDGRLAPLSWKLQAIIASFPFQLIFSEVFFYWFYPWFIFFVCTIWGPGLWISFSSVYGSPSWWPHLQIFGSRFLFSFFSITCLLQTAYNFFLFLLITTAASIIGLSPCLMNEDGMLRFASHTYWIYKIFAIFRCYYNIFWKCFCTTPSNQNV